MAENGTYYTTSEVISAQLIIVSVVTVTSVLLLLAILAITITTAVDRYRNRTKSERPIECNVYLVQESGRIVGTIRPVNENRHSPGQGYEDMSQNILLSNEPAYESVD